MTFEEKVFNINAVVHAGIMFFRIPGTLHFSASLNSWNECGIDAAIWKKDVVQAQWSVFQFFKKFFINLSIKDFHINNIQ